MGITIHFTTKFRGGKKELVKKMKEIADFSRILGFKESGPIYEMDYSTDFDTPDKLSPMVKDEETGKMEIDASYRWAKIQARPDAGWIDGSASVYKQMKQRAKIEKMNREVHKNNGFVLSLWWGEGCEATNLCFIRTGNGNVWKGHSFTKTQYAEEFVKAHVAVCTLLKAAVKSNLVVNVSDEGDYYESEDITQLTDASQENLKIIQSMTGMLQASFGAENVQGAGLDAGKLLKEYDLKGNE